VGRLGAAPVDLEHLACYQEVVGLAALLTLAIIRDVASTSGCLDALGWRLLDHGWTKLEPVSVPKWPATILRGRASRGDGASRVATTFSRPMHSRSGEHCKNVEDPACSEWSRSE
jgi:hypothetical protein